MTYLETVKKLLGLDESHYPQVEIEKLPGLVSKSKGGNHREIDNVSVPRILPRKRECSIQKTVGQ